MCRTELGEMASISIWVKAGRAASEDDMEEIIRTYLQVAAVLLHRLLIREIEKLDYLLDAIESGLVQHGG